MNLAASYKQVRQAVVAFAPKITPPGTHPFEFVFGTGFIVADSVIATNRHVAECFDTYPDGKVVAIVFVRRPNGMVMVLLDVTNAVIIENIVQPKIYYGPDRPDVALVSVACTGLLPLAVKLNVDCAAEGEAIATAGFPMGHHLLHLEGQFDHVSPTLQGGIVSAVLPFPDPTVTHGYLINVMVQGGASGSPVFLQETGEVIGAVYASRLDINRAPINFTHVVPSHFLATVLAECETNLMQFVPQDAPMLSEIIETIPTGEMEQKMIQGEHKHRRNGDD